MAEQAKKRMGERAWKARWDQGELAPDSTSDSDWEDVGGLVEVEQEVELPREEDGGEGVRGEGKDKKDITL